MSTINTYDIGDVSRVVGTFTASGTLTDPTTVTLKVRTPAGVETSYTYGGGTVTKSSTGVFYKDLDCTAAGKWSYRFVGTGAVKAAGESFFTVRPSGFDAP